MSRPLTSAARGDRAVAPPPITTPLTLHKLCLCELNFLVLLHHGYTLLSNIGARSSWLNIFRVQMSASNSKSLQSCVLITAA